MRLAAEAAPFQAVVDPDDPSFLKPGDMPSRLREFCRRTRQKAPASNGEVVRCVLESLALKYRFVLEHLEELVGRRLDPVHIVGGGSQNRLLNQFTADATGRHVVAGPVEATAIGNVVMQAMAGGQINSLAEGRAWYASRSRRQYSSRSHPQAGTKPSSGCCRSWRARLRSVCPQ